MCRSHRRQVFLKIVPTVRRILKSIDEERYVPMPNPRIVLVFTLNLSTSTLIRSALLEGIFCAIRILRFINCPTYFPKYLDTSKKTEGRRLAAAPRARLKIKRKHACFRLRAALLILLRVEVKRFGIDIRP